MIHRFAGFELDSHSLTLFYRSERVDLPRKTVRMLCALVERPDSVVTKDELLTAVWPEGYVEEGNLSQHVYLLRRAFRQRGLTSVIETYPCRGYSFRPPVVPAGPNRRSGIRLALAAVLSICLLVASAPHSAASDEATSTAYALGRYYLNLRSVDAMKRSTRYFALVAARLPDRAAGYAGLADAYTMLYDFEQPCAQCNQWRAAAQRNASEATRIEPASAEAHVSAGMVARIFALDDDRAASEFATALSIDPGNALAHEWLGNLLVAHGALDKGRRELQIAALQQPVATATYAWLARADYYARRYAEAERYAREALELQPSRLETRVILGLVQEARGEYRGALSQFDLVARLGPRIDATVLRASVFASMGQREKAIGILRRVATRAAGDPYAARDIVLAYAAADDTRDARANLARLRYATQLDRRLFAQDPHLAVLQPGPAAHRSN